MADTNIENLKIEVQASSDAAEASLRALLQTMEDLKKACQGGCGLKSFVQPLKDVADAAKQMDNSTAAKLSSMASALSKLSGLGKFNIPSSLGDRIRDLGGAVGSLRSGLEGVTQERLLSLSQALGALRDVGDVKISPTIGKQIEAIGTAASLLPADLGTKLQDFGLGMKALEGLGDIRISSTISERLFDIGSAVDLLRDVDFSCVDRLTQAAQGLNGLTIPANLNSQLSKLAETGEKIRDVDFSGFTNLATALQPLIAQIQTLNGNVPNLTQYINQLNQATNNFAQSSRNAANSSVNLAVAFMGAIRAVQRISQTVAGWIDKSNQYIEDVNLFNASMGEYAEQAANYANQVGELMGIDPGTWMRNQGVFQTLATGFGVAADRAYIMSKNLTQLGYDLSSFFNISVSDAMLKLQSGLSGELEPLRRLGYDLSQARLKALALQLGIRETFNEMSQAEKAQLRYYAILTQVTTAQGDMARTLDTPANQLRVLKAQAEQAARALGNTFIPVLNAILPYAIAAANAIRMIANALASLFHFAMPEVDYSGISGAAGAANDLDQNLGSAGGSAKKLNELLADWDELNIIQSESGGGGGGGSGAGGGAGAWDFDLPEYDFLGGLIKTRADAILAEWKPVITWIEDNLESILAVAEGIGAAIMGWSLAKRFMPSIKKTNGLLNNLLKGVAAIAIEAATVALNIHFTGDFLEKGNWGSLVGGVITDVSGSSLVGRIVQSMFTDQAFGKTVGTITTGISFVINGLVSMNMAIDDVSAKGITKENLMILAKGVLESALGIGIAANSGLERFLGAKTSIGEKAEIGVASLALAANVAANLTLTKGALTNDDPWEVVGSLFTDVGTAMGAGYAVEKLVGNGAGYKVTGLILMLDTVMDLYLAAENAAADGFTASNIATIAKSALEAAGAGWLFAHITFPGYELAGAGAALVASIGIGLSFYGTQSISNAEDNFDWGGWIAKGVGSIVTVGGVSLIASNALNLSEKGKWTLIGAALSIESAINLVTTLGDVSKKGWTSQKLASAILDEFKFGVGLGILAKALGASTALSIGVVGLALAATIPLTAVIAINSMKAQADENLDVKWGSTSLSESQIQSKVDSLFSFDVQVHVDSITAYTDETTKLVSNVSTDLTSLENALTGLRLGLDRDSSYQSIHDTLLGADGQMGEGSLLGDMQTLLKQKQLNVQAFVTLGNGAGTEDGADWVRLFNLTSSDITTELTEAGKAWGEYFSNGFEGVAMETANNLLQYMYEITSAATKGQREATFQIAFDNLQIKDMDQSTALSVVKQYAEMESALLQGYIDSENETFSAISGQRAAYQAMIDNYQLAHPGQNVPAEYLQRMAELDALYLELQTDRQNGYQQAREKWMGDVQDSRAMLSEELQSLYDGQSDYILRNGGQSYENLFFDIIHAAESMFGVSGSEELQGIVMTGEEAGEFFNAGLTKFVEENLPEDMRSLIASLPEGMNFWDVLSPELKTSLYDDFWDEFGLDNLQTLMTTQGDDFESMFPDLEIESPDLSATEGAVTGLGTTVTETASIVHSGVQAMLKDLAMLGSISFGSSGGLGGSARLSGFRGVIPTVSFTLAAAGGLFDEGEFFMARERGPELVGQIGHKTAVANNKQIEGGISVGVKEANEGVERGLDRLHDDMRVLITKSGRMRLEPSTALARTVRRSEEMRLQSEGV